jgi:carbamoyltransferase
MLVLGLAGGVDPVYRKQFDSPFNLMGHDTAAVLLDGGRVAAAVEQERLDRIKHSNKAPFAAIRFCLDDHVAELRDVERIAVYATENFLNARFRQHALTHPEQEAYPDARALVRRLIRQEFGHDPGDEKLHFVHHHWAHALSAFAPSGFERSLVVTIDGQGDGVAGMVFDGEGAALRPLRSIPEAKSLGLFYLWVVRFLGFTLFEEYKVMGLAPYGDPARFRTLFENFYHLLPDGDFVIHTASLARLFDVAPPRRKGGPLEQLHKDIAAALQEALETVALHMLSHFAQRTGHTALCLAGGVAHNCSMNGKILASGIFREVFVQPAAHDAGCALGAALHAARALGPRVRPARVEHVYWGPHVGGAGELGRQLSAWAGVLDFERVGDIEARAAELLAGGSVIGWVQGRSEFGPRALGNRSILADPRPAENKNLINRMIKNREAFRPFAPAVLRERVDEFFITPEGQRDFPFMLFTLKVREEKRALLGAVTHVDATARVQTVGRGQNPKFYALIESFDRLTGVPVLLNTSFNNDVEPIVDSVTDAVVCFLTTGLHHLVVGDYLVSRKAGATSCLGLVPSLPQYAALRQVKGFVSAAEVVTTCELINVADERQRASLSPEAFELLARADGEQSLGALLDASGLPGERKAELEHELFGLWSRRLVRFGPRGADAPRVGGSAPAAARDAEAQFVF